MGGLLPEVERGVVAAAAAVVVEEVVVAEAVGQEVLLPSPMEDDPHQLPPIRVCRGSGQETVPPWPPLESLGGCAAQA